MCQQLPDSDHPFKSYLRLQNFIQNNTAKNYTWFSWPIKYTNTTQPSINFQQFINKFSNDTLESEYQAFNAPFTYYFQKLQKARMDETFTTFDINILKHNISLTSDTIIHVSDLQDKLQILENNRFSQQQFIQLYARKLWRLDFIRQNILQKHLILWKLRKFMAKINKTSDFKQDEIYEHKMVGNKLYSWNRFRILGPIDYEHRYTIPVLKPELDMSWSPAKIAVVLGSIFAAGTTLAYGLYNLFFAGSTSTDSSPFYAQVSLSVINNRTFS